MKRLGILVVCLFMPLFVIAQNTESGVLRSSCTPDGLREPYGRRGITTRSTNEPIQIWDSTRTYRQLVILVEFSDAAFKRNNPREFYDRIFNEKGYNEGKGPGCVADYFREQSNGFFKPEFDLYGPFRATAKIKTETEFINHGSEAIKQAYEQFMADYKDMDLKVYDWDGNGEIEQILFVLAGHMGAIDSVGYPWPNSGYMFNVKDLNGKSTDLYYSATSELWDNNYSMGIGTICHEYCHCLGLPDIYPVNRSAAFSVCDEWDLMDGGNYTNWGWCPPNLTAQEKMYLGWYTPTELNVPISVSGLKSISEGGESYIIYHTEKEYLILENRQRKGWDVCIPGQGLIILYVDFDSKEWRYNAVNEKNSHYRYYIISADNLSYSDWDNIVSKDSPDSYVDPSLRMYRKHLSTSPYPYRAEDSTYVNDCLTDSSVPASKMYNLNADKSKMLGKPITNIRLADDGTVSFDFMLSSAGMLSVPSEFKKDSWYNIGGYRLENRPNGAGIYINNGKKVFIK